MLKENTDHYLFKKKSEVEEENKIGYKYYFYCLFKKIKRRICVCETNEKICTS